MSGQQAAAFTKPLERFEAALARLEQAPRFARRNHISRLLDAAEQVLRHPGGARALFPLAPRFEDAGVFADSDWDHPERLQASFVPRTLADGDLGTVTLECLSQLRLLAIADGSYVRTGCAPEQAGHQLRKILAQCLEYVFDRQSEASRGQGRRREMASEVLRFVAESVGYETLLQQLIDEIWRLLRQRPINIGPIQTMVTKLSLYCYDPDRKTATMPVGADRLISSLYSPSAASREDPGVGVYHERLSWMDPAGLLEEATACARSMRDTGLVSPYHAVLVRFLLDEMSDMIPVALGLNNTGVDAFLHFRDLIHALIDKAVHPETCQCLYGLAALLERGVLHNPAIPASLWRQIKLPLTVAAQGRIATGCGSARPPDVFLLAGVISILGQPLGIGQGDNPTCQSARALSLWAYSDPDYLLQLLAWAARDDGVLMTFRGLQISSAFLPQGGAGKVGSDLDPVSLVLVPHLDRVYAEMTRLASTASEDPHSQVNPEFHGWRVGRGFAIAVDVPSGRLAEYEDFIRLFYACYHPAYQGGHPVIHPQPVGLAITDSLARFVGWHAVTLLRVSVDPTDAARVYFYNPNNDGGQDWGNGIVVSTDGHGEVPGESSLSITQFASRLYLFHYDPLEVWDKRVVPDAEVQEVMALGRGSWASARLPEIDRSGS